MNPILEIDSSNFEHFAFRYYDNPHCSDIEEFRSDLKRFKYLKKIVSRYQDTGVFNERLALNHIIVIFNVWGIVPSLKMMNHKMEPEHWPVLKPCLLFLGYITKNDYPDINIDEVVEAKLRGIE